VWERVWKRAVRDMPALLRHYLRGLALLIKRPRLAQELQDREQRLKELKQQHKELKSRLAKERREATRPKKVREKEVKLHPPVGEAHFGDLRRLRPIGRNFGFERGRPVDRYYIENFLARQAEDIRGRVLEIANASYTRRYGGSRVEISDVLDVAEDNPQATILADLTHADHVPPDAFDCVILTQTLHLIYDVRPAIRTLHRILKPGGVLLATFPGISQIGCRGCSDHWCWSFTQLSARRLFEEAFPAQNVELEAYGNVLAAISFLHGLVVEELRQEELDYHDPDYEVLITLRAVKPESRP
jgi:SAM-dependent methyltransferase